MKILLSCCLVIFVTLGTLSCKKSADAPPKDYAASVTNKNWWGTLAYTGKTTEYYSVAFKADNSLTWSQRSSDTQGLWALEGNTITITFTGNTVQIKATISDDNKFINIQDNTAASEITSGQLITTPNVYLDNTNWKGTIPTSSQTIQLSFPSPLNVKIAADGGTPMFGPYPYSRVAAGSAIRFSSAAFGGDVFGILVSATEMKGGFTIGVKNYQWNATLQ